jgi:hypothetical protein
MHSSAGSAAQLKLKTAIDGLGSALGATRADDPTLARVGLPEPSAGTAG